jgi:ferritin
VLRKRRNAMLTEKIESALNAQLNAETYSAYLYFSMSANFRSVNLDGFASWMFAQAIEELTHAKKFHDFIFQRGGRVTLTQIDGPPVEWDSPESIFQETLSHEQKVTGLINSLVDMAIQESDHATHIFLQWFVTEQVEEEETADGVLQQLKQLGNSKNGLYMMDREMAQRGTAAPSAE